MEPRLFVTKMKELTIKIRVCLVGCVVRLNVEVIEGSSTASRLFVPAAVSCLTIRQRRIIEVPLYLFRCRLV